MITIFQIQDSVHVIQNSLEQSSALADNRVWFWVAIVEAICITLLLLVIVSRSKYTQAQLRFKSEAKKSEIDFDNVIASSFHANDLYNQLKKVCHPDRFTANPAIMAKADELFQQITQSKHDYKKLQELKIKAMEELHINL